MTDRRDPLSSNPALDDEVDGLLESLTANEGESGELDAVSLEHDRHSAKTEPPAPGPAVTVRPPPPAVTAKPPVTAQPGVTAPAPPAISRGFGPTETRSRPVVPRLSRPASSTMKGKWPAPEPSESPAPRDALPTLFNETPDMPVEARELPPPPTARAQVPPRMPPRVMPERVSPTKSLDDDEIEAALMGFGDSGPMHAEPSVASIPRAPALPSLGTVQKPPAVPVIAEYAEESPTVLGDSSGTADSFMPPMMDSAESLEDLDAVELESGADVLANMSFDSEPPRPPAPTLDIDDDDGEEALFAADGPSVEASTASLDTFEGWEEESVTTIHPPPAGGVTEDSSVEFASTTLEDLDVDGETLGDSEPPPSTPRKSLSDLARDPGQGRPAARHLDDQRLVDAWVARAEWFEEEGQGTGDPPARARLFLAASELWAMAGNLGRASETAKRSAQALPSLALAARQARAIDALEGDYKAVVAALDAESRAAPSDAARAHAAYLASDVYRIALDDPENAERRLDVAARAAPKDPRAPVTRLAKELGADAGAAKTKIAEEPELEALATAAAVLSALRGGPRREDVTVPLISFEDARHALSVGDRERAGRALTRLQDVPALGDGGLWLAASLLSPSAETRDEAIAALSLLDKRAPSPAARRALAARALEQGDQDAMSGALSVDDAEAPAFGPEDRVALGALSGGDPAALADAALAVIENEPLRPLAAAATAASAVTANLPIGDPEVRARVALGRRLATVKTLDELKDAVHAMRAASNESPLGRLLSLELDAAAGAHSAVAAELNRLAPSSDPSGALAAALIEEASGHDDVAHRHYVAALGAPDVAEAAARALLAPGDANAAQILSTLAGVLGEEGTPRQSLLLFEAAARTEPSDTAAVEELLAKAHDASPTLPFAPRMGADLALAAGDVPRLLEWLTRRQKTAKDPMLRALDAVREALLVADDDPKRAAERVAEALEVRPEDVALHELAERLDPTRTIERARVREQLSERATSPRARARLLFEAAIEYERQGARADAARAARAAGATGGSELAQAAAERYSVDAHAEAPSGLAKLRADEQAAMASPTDEGMLAVARALSTLTDPGEAAAHARLAARLQELAEPSDAPLEARPKLAEGAEQSLWALRDDEAHARLAGDDEAVLRTTRELAKRSPRPFDAAVLSLRAAEAALRLGQKDEAIALVSRTLGVVKDHLVARALRAALTEESDPKTAANDLEALATDSSVTEHRFDAFYRAAVLRLDRTGETDLGREALEKAAEIDITQRDVFDRLQVLYVQKGDRQKLADLLEKRLAGTDDPELRISLEVTRGKALSDIGDRDAARRALNAALEANPDHADALEAFAGLAAADGDFEGAEQALIRLARTATEPERQAAIYRKLAKLYDGDLPNPSRAEICYREILKRLPDDADAMQSLVFVYVRLGDAVKALELATQLVDKAQANDEKRDRTLALSRVYDEAGKDKKSALSVLEKARKTWPHDRAVLRAVATFHERHGETAAQTVLLDRATAEARRALSHGRFELSFFGILETAAELRGNVDASTVASATLAALECRDDVAVRGAGAAAADVRLDDLLAPELLSAPLRALLKKLPGVLDAAYPLDTKALRTQPLPPSAADLAQEIRIVAESVGIRALELLVSPTLGPVFVAASTSPARLVMGQALLDSSDFEARYFSLFRTLKAMQAEASAFTRIAPIEQWPALAGLLSLVAPSFSPQGVDAAKLADARRKLSAVLPAKIDADVETLALEVASAVGNRGSQLGQATGQWGSRTALLAVGSPRVALRGVALSLGQPGGPPEGAAERVKWVLRHPEARDLTVFSVSDNHAEARKRVGLTE